jgi:hypothetical protein
MNSGYRTTQYLMITFDTFITLIKWLDGGQLHLAVRGLGSVDIAVVNAIGQLDECREDLLVLLPRELRHGFTGVSNSSGGISDSSVSWALRKSCVVARRQRADLTGRAS